MSNQRTGQDVNETADVKDAIERAFRQLDNLSRGNLSPKQKRVLEGVEASLTAAHKQAEAVNDRIGASVFATLRD